MRRWWFAREGGGGRGESWLACGVGCLPQQASKPIQTHAFPSICFCPRMPPTPIIVEARVDAPSTPHPQQKSPFTLHANPPTDLKLRDKTRKHPNQPQTATLVSLPPLLQHPNYALKLCVILRGPRPRRNASSTRCCCSARARSGARSCGMSSKACALGRRPQRRGPCGLGGVSLLRFFHGSKWMWL